jgi:hypothetical protein
MLREIAAVRQDTPGLLRRWFEDEYFDLFVWIAADGEIAAFQLAYDKGARERVLGWDRTGGYLHRSVDSGEASGFQSMTPLLTKVARFPKYRVIAQFDARAQALDDSIRRFVRDKAARYLPRTRLARRRTR